jgi:hypothetical protein
LPRLKERPVRYAKLQRLLRSYGLTGNRIHEAIGVSHVTGKKKMDNPELFTVQDLESISRSFGIPWDDVREALVR